VASLAACSAPPSEPHHSHGATVSSAAVAQCVPDFDDAVRERKERIAKGMFYASRKREVDGPLERWDTPYGDGGAHFGGFTRTALDAGARLVVAIDIAPENIAALRRNFASEIAAGRVIVIEKGVWDSEGTLVLERQNNTWADHVAAEGEGPPVALTTVDRIVTELKLGTVDFIKLDIEGAERRAIAGAAGTLRTHRPRMAIAAYHEPDDVDAISRAALAGQPEYEVCIQGLALGHGYTTLLFK
jgi:FkbM family methyltransferase